MENKRVWLSETYFTHIIHLYLFNLLKNFYVWRHPADDTNWHDIWGLQVKGRHGSKLIFLDILLEAWWLGSFLCIAFLLYSSIWAINTMCIINIEKMYITNFPWLVLFRYSIVILLCANHLWPVTCCWWKWQEGGLLVIWMTIECDSSAHRRVVASL